MSTEDQLARYIELRDVMRSDMRKQVQLDHDHLSYLSKHYSTTHDTRMYQAASLIGEALQSIHRALNVLDGRLTNP